ncbi:MAG: hypothetical protein U9N10_07045, partial [Bacillota bacterium]|nr:hypothetical protein [Bacillota bacterium]
MNNSIYKNIFKIIENPILIIKGKTIIETNNACLDLFNVTNLSDCNNNIFIKNIIIFLINNKNNNIYRLIPTKNKNNILYK